MLREMRLQALIWIQYSCAQLHLSRSTFHSALTLFDSFFESFHPLFSNTCQLELVAFTCLHMAQKIEEIEKVDINTLA